MQQDRPEPSGGRSFTEEFRRELDALFRWRRDVRRFRRAPVPPAVLDDLLAQMDCAPSVGNSQPWRVVSVESERCRAQVQANFRQTNAQALAGYEGDRARLYATLKLAGLEEAPVQWAVFVDEETEQGHGLGRRTMPESLAYSVVIAVHTVWLAARSVGLGMGWLSILDPDAVGATLEVPEGWRLVAYLCIGWPQEEHEDPELERAGWQERRPGGPALVR